MDNLMRSKLHIKGHPLHPMLVMFPISFFTGALVLDILFWMTADAGFSNAAVYAEAGGLISAVGAAVPGIVDYIHRVPPKSSAKKRATKHAMVNAAIVIIFSSALALRTLDKISLPLLVAMESAGVLLLGITAWLGGTLVARNQIGIDHRYAEAGKWKEEIIRTRKNIVELKDADEMKLNQMKLFRINDQRIVIARTESGFLAFDDHCTHRGGSLADGVVICGTVQCPWHGSQFDVSSGVVKAGPARDKIKTYRLHREENRFYLQLKD